MKVSLLRHRAGSGAVLLAAAAVWLVSVSLCSTRTLAEPPDDDHDHVHAADSAAHHAHEESPPGEQEDDDCGCESFKSFPAETETLPKVLAPATAVLLYAILLNEPAYESAATAVLTRDTGPPGRIPPDELVWQRCRFSHAPPFVV